MTNDNTWKPTIAPQHWIAFGRLIVLDGHGLDDALRCIPHMESMRCDKIDIQSVDSVEQSRFVYDGYTEYHIWFSFIVREPNFDYCSKHRGPIVDEDGTFIGNLFLDDCQQDNRTFGILIRVSALCGGNMEEFREFCTADSSYCFSAPLHKSGQFMAENPEMLNIPETIVSERERVFYIRATARTCEEFDYLEATKQCVDRNRIYNMTVVQLLD